jgi:sortase A
MKYINKKFISILLIFLGVSIILYPKIKDRYISYKQNKLISLWEESLQVIDNDVSSENNEIASNILVNKSHYSENNVSSDGLLSEKKLIMKLKNEQKQSQEIERKKKEAIIKKRQEFIKSHMEGILKIEKISLSLPILRGATKRNLDFSISSIDGTGKPWATGNYAIAGHRSHAFGRNFNRLDELIIGDYLEVIDLENNHYSYIIKEKIIVNAEDTWVLNSIKNKREITLVTCHPLYEKNPPTRLIIKGEMIE